MAKRQKLKAAARKAKPVKEHSLAASHAALKEGSLAAAAAANALSDLISATVHTSEIIDALGRSCAALAKSGGRAPLVTACACRSLTGSAFQATQTAAAAATSLARVARYLAAAASAAAAASELSGGLEDARGAYLLSQRAEGAVHTCMTYKAMVGKAVKNLQCLE